MTADRSIREDVCRPPVIFENAGAITLGRAMLRLLRPDFLDQISGVAEP